MFTLAELVKCPAKNNAWKKKRNDSEAKVEKEGASAAKEVSTFLKGISKGVSLVPAMNLRWVS